MPVINFERAIVQVYHKFNSGVLGRIVTLKCVNMHCFIKGKRTQSSMRQSSIRHQKLWESLRNIKRLGQINLLPIKCHLKLRIQTVVNEPVSILKIQKKY